MTQFMANLKNELFKLRRRKKYYVFLILGAILCIASGLRLALVNYVLGTKVSRAAVMGGLVADNQMFFLLIFLPLMAILASSDLFVGEISDHTIRFSLMRPVSKEKLFFSKAAAVWILCAFDLAVLFIATSLTQLILGGTAEGIGVTFLSCLFDLIPLAVLILFFCLVNQWGRSAGLSVLLCIVLYVGLWALGTYQPSLGGLLFTGYIRWHNLWVGVTLPFLSLLPRIGLLAGYGLVFGCCGFLLFDRKEV